MKYIITLLLSISLISCSFLNETKVDFSIKNSSQKVLKNIVFKTSSDSIHIDELKPNESFEKELLYSISNKDENKATGFSLSFFRDTIKDDNMFCKDISTFSLNRKMNLIILENEIKTDIQGIECY